MKGRRFWASLGVVAATAMVVAPIAVLSAASAGADVTAQSTATVATAQELATQWALTANTRITLTADIVLSNASSTCFIGEPYRPSGGSGIVVDGQGQFGITDTCGLGRILGDGGTEPVTLTGLTHFDGGLACGEGGGLYTGGPVTIVNVSASNNSATDQSCPLSAGAASQGGVHVADNSAVGGAIYSDSGGVTVQNSTFTNNHADLAGGAIGSIGPVTDTGSTFSNNSAGISGYGDNLFEGGAVLALGDVTATGSTFTGNFIGDSKGTCHSCAAVGGAVASIEGSTTATLSSATFTSNHADCAYDCEGEGGAVVAEHVITDASTFSGNTASAQACQGIASAVTANSTSCFLAGGAVSANSLSDTGSTFDDNHADCVSDCDNFGGSISSDQLHLTGTTVSNSSARCTDDCAAFGGGIVAGQNGAGVGSVGAGALKALAEPHTYPGWKSDSAHVLAPTPPSTDVSIVQSDVAGNTAACDTGNCGADGGGAYLAAPSSALVDASTFSGNTATYYGGAIYLPGVADQSTSVTPATTPVTIQNSTVTGNSSGDWGALDLDFSDVKATLAYDTIVQNTTTALPEETAVPNAASAWGGSVHADIAARPANLSAFDLTSFGTIVALPLGGQPNCLVDAGGSTTSQGYNWSDDTSCGFTAATDKVATPNDPQLNALADWGGPTPTMLPVTPKNGGAISPVIDAIPPAACQTGAAAGITTDQRGVTRPQLLGCDIGAVEVTLQDYQVEAAAVIAPKFTG